MQNVLVSVSYSTSRNSRHIGSYRVEIGSTDEPITDALRSDPEVYNDTAWCRGVFGREADAVRSVLGYINAPCSLIEISDALSSDKVVRLVPIDERHPQRNGVSIRLLGRRTTRGIYVADPLPIRA